MTHKMKMKILERIYLESNAYFRNKAVQKQRANKIVSLNEWYKRESNRREAHKR